MTGYQPLEGYVLREIKAQGNCFFLELVRNKEEPDSIIDELIKKDHQAAKRLFRLIEKIRQQGIDNLCKTKQARLIDSSLRLYELKHFYGAERIMCHIEGDTVIVSKFKGHCGSNKIPKKELEKAKRKCEIAAALLANRRGCHDRKS